VKGLIDLGLLQEEDIDKIIEDEKYKPYCMHGTSHWLGLDTHDLGFLKIPSHENNKPEERKLVSGMILTVEPGLYFNQDHIENLPKEFHDIGIRIEDDILINENGCEILTRDVPKEIDEIEAIMK
jgi:Xaa-Pro aminopeptidase